MDFDKILNDARKSSEVLYNEDIVYKTLVDNYIQASIDYDKKQSKAKKNEKIDSSRVSESINALAKYKDVLHKKNVLAFVEYINLTNEDIRDMMCNGILDSKVIIAILKFKGIIKSEGDE